MLDFDALLPELAKASRLPDDWWKIDLCFYPDAWGATQACKTRIDKLNENFG